MNAPNRNGIRRQNIHVDRAGTQLGFEKRTVDALTFFLLLLLRIRRTGNEVVGGINRDKVAVEKLDDLGIGERTRSHGESAASATSDVHPAIVSEEKNR